MGSAFGGVVPQLVGEFKVVADLDPRVAVGLPGEVCRHMSKLHRSVEPSAMSVSARVHHAEQLTAKEIAADQAGYGEHDGRGLAQPQQLRDTPSRRPTHRERRPRDSTSEGALVSSAIGDSHADGRHTRRVDPVGALVAHLRTYLRPLRAAVNVATSIARSGTNPWRRERGALAAVKHQRISMSWVNDGDRMIPAKKKSKSTMG